MSQYEEHLKLLAGWFNITSAGSVTVGIIAPTINHYIGATERNPDLASWIPWICIPLAIFLHLMAHLFLTWLPEEETDDEQ